MPNYRIQIQVDGNNLNTLQDILPSNEKLKALFIGKVPTPLSVNEGHYFQGRQGKMFWNKLQKYEILNVPTGSYEDEQLLGHKYGMIDIVKIPRVYGTEPTQSEYENGAKRVLNIIDIYKPMVIIFIYKKVLDKILEYEFDIHNRSHYGFNEELEEIFDSKVFVFSMPGTPCNKEDADQYMGELKDVLDNSFQTQWKSFTSNGGTYDEKEVNWGESVGREF